MIGKKVIVVTFLTLALVFSGSALLLKSEKIQADSYFSKISGLQEGDFLRIETFSGGEYKTLHEEKILDRKSLTLKDIENLNLDDKYLVLINVISEDGRQATDITF
ncbi:MAG: hypothetical protein AAF569_09085, partial [Pseudomonadota bacterium]